MGGEFFQSFCLDVHSSSGSALSRETNMRVDATWLMWWAMIYGICGAARSKMRTLHFGPVQPLASGEEFDKRLWLKSALPRGDDRCSKIAYQTSQMSPDLTTTQDINLMTTQGAVLATTQGAVLATTKGAVLATTQGAVLATTQGGVPTTHQGISSACAVIVTDSSSTSYPAHGQLSSSLQRLEFTVQTAGNTRLDLYNSQQLFSIELRQMSTTIFRKYGDWASEYVTTGIESGDGRFWISSSIQPMCRWEEKEAPSPCSPSFIPAALMISGGSCCTPSSTLSGPSSHRLSRKELDTPIPEMSFCMANKENALGCSRRSNTCHKGDSKGDQGGYRRRNGRRRSGSGMTTVTGMSTEEVTSNPEDSTTEDVHPTCRNYLPSANHTRVFELFSNVTDQDPFAFPLHLNGSNAEVAAIRTDVCPSNLTSCFHGFTVSMWLVANDTSVTDEGAYFLSSGAQRAESCGFYFRLDSVTSDPSGSRVGVFGIAVATSDTVWQVRYQASMSVKSHVLMSWEPDVGLDVYVDGVCAGNGDEGYQRYPSTSCSDDPFQDVYIGGRNDLTSGGFVVADIGQLSTWDAWKSRDDVYNPEEEGVLLACYEACVPWGFLNTSLQLPTHLVGSHPPLPWQCRAVCDGFKYSAIGGAPPECYCLANYTHLQSDPLGSCQVCPGYHGITCGGPASLSLYHMPSFLQPVPALQAIQGLTVSVDGVQSDGNYSVTTQTNVNISFYLSAGEDVLYSISGDDRLNKVQTFQTSTYLLFPEAGWYQLTITAANQISRIEKELWVIAEDDPAQLDVPLVAIFSASPAGVSEPVSVWIEIANGSPEMTCHLDFGDGRGDVFLANQSSLGLTHRYDSSGLFLLTVRCDLPDSQSINTSATIIIQEHIAITLTTTFRVINGNNLTIPFEVTGTNITKLQVLLDGMAFSNFTCSENFSCEGFLGERSTDTCTPGTHVFEVQASNLISGQVTSRADVYVGIPISNVTYQINCTVAIPNQAIQLTADVTEGTLLYIHFDFAGNSTVQTCDNAPCAVSHTQSFPEEGFYNVSVEVSNDFNAFASKIYSVGIFNPVPALRVDIINSSSIRIPVELCIYPESNASLWPTEAKVVFTIAGFQNQLQEDFVPLSNADAVVVFFLTLPVYGIFDVTGNVSNAVNFMMLYSPIQIGEDIQGFYACLPSLLHATGENVGLELGFTAGSDVVVVLDFGDGSLETHPLNSPEVGFISNTTIYHRYNSSGEYNITVRAHSIFRDEVRQLFVRIINPIDGLRMDVGDTAKATGEPIQFVFSLEKGVLVPQTVHCSVDYGDDSQMEFWNGVLSDGNITTEHTYLTHGSHHVQANCSNEVSQVDLTVNVTLNTAIAECEVFVSTPVAATNTTVQYLTTVNGSSDVTVLIQFGDGTNMSTHIDSVASMITEHVYLHPDSYTVHLIASNPVSECEAFSIPVVIQTPILTHTYNLTILPTTVDIAKQPTVFALSLMNEMLLPTNVTAHWTFGDGNSSSQTLTSGVKWSISHTFEVTGEYEISVHLVNLMSELDLNATVEVLEWIGDVDYNITTAAAVADNLTLSILVSSGTSLSYNIDYGDGIIVTLFQDEPEFLELVHSYDQVGTFVLTIRVENGLGWITLNQTAIRVVYPVQGLNFETSTEERYSPGNITFSLTIDEGVPPPTIMECIWRKTTVRLGYATDVIMRQKNVSIESGESLNVTHYFPGGQFLVTLQCRNILSSLTLQQMVFIFEEVADLNIFPESLVAEVGSQVLMTVTTSQGSLLNYDVQYGDGTKESRTVVMSTQTKMQEFLHAYTASGVFSPSVTAENILGASNATSSIEVLHSTQGFQLLSNSPKTFPDLMMTLQLVSIQGTTPPLTVDLAWNFGDGSVDYDTVQFNASRGVNHTHSYNSSGTYHAEVTVTNNLDSHTFETDVIINDEAAPVLVRFEYQNKDSVWTSGLGQDFNWFPEDSVIRLSANVTSEDATVIWEFDNGETAPLDTVHRRYETPGVYNATLKVQSYTDELLEYHFRFYIVQPFDLTSIQAVDESGVPILMSGKPVDLTLNGNGLDGPMCVSWDVGDQTSQIVYGPEPCRMQQLNDVIFAQSTQEGWLQVSHIYASPGFYSVNVSVSTFLTTASASSDITVLGCWSPPDVSIRGPGQTIDAPQSHRTSETILIDSVTTFDCIGVGLTIFTWEVFTLILDDVQNITQKLVYNVPSVNGPQLQLEPGSLDVGLYEIALTVTVPVFVNATGTDKVYVQIDHSPLVLILEGGSNRSVGTVQPLILDAMTSSYDPDNVAGNSSDWSFEWTCKRLSELSENGSTSTNPSFVNTDYLCENSSWERLNFTAGIIRLNPLQLRVGAVYAFQVGTVIGSRHASYQQIIQVMQGQPPLVSISCVANCRAKTNPTSSFTLQGSCDNCDAYRESVFTWSLYVKQQETGEFKEVRNLGDMTSTGVSKQGIAFNPDQLDAGREYNLRLDVKDELLGNGFTQHSFLTNLPPYNGSCQVTPMDGFAVTTEFSVNCSGWLEEGHAVDRASISNHLAAKQVLQYRVLSRPKGQTSFSLKTSATDSSISGILFEVGPEAFSFQNEVRVEIVDMYGAAVHVDMTITVRTPDLSLDDITSLVSSNGSKLSLLISTGNVEGATQLISAVLTILQVDNSTIPPEELTEIRSSLVLEIGKISVWAKTAEALQQGASLMSQSLTGGVNDDALIDAAASMARMAMSLQEVDTDNPEVVVETAKGLTGGLGSIIAQSDGIVQKAMGTSEVSMYTTTPSSLGSREQVVFDVYGDDLSPEETAEQAAKDEEERLRNEEDARTVALTISTLAQETLDLVSSVVIGQRVTGQPPVTLVTDQLTLEVFKDEPNSVAERVLTADVGSFQLPNASSLFGTSGVKQVQQIMYSYNANPYSFSKSSDTIGSQGVLTLELHTGQGKPLSVQNLTDMISITLDVDDSKATSAESVQMRFRNMSTMNYHKVEIQEKKVQLRVVLKEISDNKTSFQVYLKKGSHPNSTTFDAVTELPKQLSKDEFWSDERLVMEASHTAVFPDEILTGVGDYYLGISLAAWDDESSAGLDDVMNTTDVNVTMVIHAAGCRYWDTNLTAWSSLGCQVGPQTTSDSIHCLCNHLSSFASSFFVPPNSIDFSTVFSKFLDLGDNAAVFATVLGFFGLYLLLLVWLRRKDKQDIVKWGVSPLANNHPSDTYFYQITVQTGIGPGCGTRSKVSIILTGECGDSGVRLLDDDKRKVFESGSICHFLMGVAKPLGPLSYIKLWHDNTGSGQHAGWYLSQVSILDLQNGKQFFFVCDRWLTVEKDDGAIERVLPVATRSDLTQFSKLFFSSSRRNLFDDHIWFSLFSRPTRSPFSRVQRLSCCLCLLYLSMITSAMFYRTEETVENPTALRLGPFIFTLQQVYIGFISALIVLPVNLLIVQIFRKSKPSQSQMSGQLPRHLQDKLDNLKDGSSSENTTPPGSVVDITADKVQLVPAIKASAQRKAKDRETKGRPYLLPHWCVYVAWLIMILSSFTAAFFTVLYSLEWGQEKSCEWLTSMLISLFNSVLIIQPFKVVVVAIILSLIFKKPTKMDVEIDSDLSHYQNQLQNDEELLHDAQSTRPASFHEYRVRLPPSKEALEAARQKRIKEVKMNHMLKETAVYTVFVIVVLFLCYTNRDALSFYMSQSLRDVFIENNGADNSSNKLTFHSLEKCTPDLFWEWVQTALIPGLYGKAYYNGVPMHWRHTRFIGDWQGYRVGPVRLRQLRVKNEACITPQEISISHVNCHLDYSWSNQDETNFSVAWQPKNEHNSMLYSDEESAPWIYHDFLELNGVPYLGILAIYSGGGYTAEFGTTSEKALQTAEFLQDSGWYDELTRALVVEFSVYNANINLFSVATLVAETSATGGALVTSYIHTLRLYHYEGTIAIFIIIFQVVFVAYLLFFIIKLLVSLKQAGLKELKNFWTAVDLLLILVGITAVAMFAVRQVFIELALQDVNNKNQGEFVNFSHIAKWDEVFGYLLACMAFLSLLRYMRLLRLNARMSLLGMTLGYASKDIFYFVIMWNIVFMAFGQLSYFLFHSLVETFSTFISTLMTLFSMLLGKFDFYALVEANRLLGGAVFFIYIVTMYMILTNMFITIVVEAFNHMRRKQAMDDAIDPEMIEYIVERFKTFFLRPSHKDTTDVSQIKVNVTYEDTLGLLEKRVDKIANFVETHYGKLEISTNQNEATSSPVRSLSRISLHSATRPSQVKGQASKKLNKRVIYLA